MHLCSFYGFKNVKLHDKSQIVSQKYALFLVFGSCQPSSWMKRSVRNQAQVSFKHAELLFTTLCELYAASLLLYTVKYVTQKKPSILRAPFRLLAFSCMSLTCSSFSNKPQRPRHFCSPALTSVLLGSGPKEARCTSLIYLVTCRYNCSVWNTVYPQAEGTSAEWWLLLTRGCKIYFVPEGSGGGAAAGYSRWAWSRHQLQNRSGVIESETLFVMQLKGTVHQEMRVQSSTQTWSRRKGQEMFRCR